MTTLEQTIETIKTLPLADRQHLQRFLQEGLQEQERQGAEPQPVARPSQPRAAETVEQQVARFRQAMKWIGEHRAEYLGQWVALEGDRLVSHGSDVLQVDAAARAAGIASPFLEQVLEEKAFCGGWV